MLCYFVIIEIDSATACAFAATRRLHTGHVMNVTHNFVGLAALTGSWTKMLRKKLLCVGHDNNIMWTEEYEVCRPCNHSNCLPRHAPNVNQDCTSKLQQVPWQSHCVSTRYLEIYSREAQTYADEVTWWMRWLLNARCRFSIYIFSKNGLCHRKL